MDVKKGKGREIAKGTTKKDSVYAWISLALALFFWVPLLNVFIFLPASILFGAKAIRLARREPRIYGGFVLAVTAVTFASISFVVSLVVLLLSSLGKI